MLLEVLLVGRHQLGLALDDQQVFRVAFLGGFSEVETPRDDGLLVDNHNLVVCELQSFGSQGGKIKA